MTTESVSPWSLVTLALFVLTNLVLLRGIWRRLTGYASAVRNSDDKGRVVREFALDRLAEMVFVGRPSNAGNPLEQVRVEIWWIGALLAVDYGTIRMLWPWLLQ